VFSVVLSVGLRFTSSNLKNGDTAKWDCFVIYTLFSRRRGANATLFYERGASFKNVCEPMMVMVMVYCLI